MKVVSVIAAFESVVGEVIFTTGGYESVTSVKFPASS